MGTQTEKQETGEPTDGLKVALEEGAKETGGTPPDSKIPDNREGGAGPASSSNGEPRFTEDDLANVRKEEKDKLYPRIEEMRTELQRLREAEEERKRLAEEQEAAEAEARQKAEEDELSAKELLLKKEEEWQNRFQTLEQEREQDRALLEKERQYNELRAYRESALAQAEDEIMPELRDLVQGTSREEIDQSIADMQERSRNILEQARSAVQQHRQQMPTVRPTSPGNIGPLEERESAEQTVTPDDIRSMSMSDYAKMRDKLLGATRARVSQQGPYRG